MLFFARAAQYSCLFFMGSNVAMLLCTATLVGILKWWIYLPAILFLVVATFLVGGWGELRDEIEEFTGIPESHLVPLGWIPCVGLILGTLGGARW